METIEWLTNWDDALAAARAQKKPIVIDVYQDNCGGCERLANETLQDRDIVRVINERFIPLTLHLLHDRDVVRPWSLFWTPTVLFADRTGKVRYESVNFLPAEDFRDILDIGEARVAMRWREFDLAIRRLEEVETRRPTRPFTAEAIYWRGIAAYFRAGRDSHVSRAVWKAIRDRFPESEWAKRQP